MNEVRLTFYGRLADEYQTHMDYPIPADGLTVQQLRERLAQGRMSSGLLSPFVKVAVGDQIVDGQFHVLPGVQVDFLAPVSGG